MEPEGSSPCSQELSNCPYPKPNESNPRLQTLWAYMFQNFRVELIPRAIGNGYQNM
jgi:hypothetical protein